MSTEKVYPEGLLGRKVGMTQVFTKDGECIAVTVLEVGPCFVLDLKSEAKHGYDSVQLGFAPKKIQRVNKADKGRIAAAGKGAFSHVKEMRCNTQKLGWTTLGQELKAADIFNDGDFVDVSGVSIGRGFAGVVKRYHMSGQPATRGTHETRRNVGSVGCRKSPGRIFKNKRMPGHLGAENVTVQNLEVVGVRGADNLVLVRGGVPGAKGSFVVVKKAIKYLKDQKAA